MSATPPLQAKGGAETRREAPRARTTRREFSRRYNGLTSVIHLTATCRAVQSGGRWRGALRYRAAFRECQPTSKRCRIGGGQSTRNSAVRNRNSLCVYAEMRPFLLILKSQHGRHCWRCVGSAEPARITRCRSRRRYSTPPRTADPCRRPEWPGDYFFCFVGRFQPSIVV